MLAVLFNNKYMFPKEKHEFAWVKATYVFDTVAAVNVMIIKWNEFYHFITINGIFIFR